MDERSAEAKARTILERDRPRSPLSHLSLPLAIVAVVGLCLGFSLLEDRLGRRLAGTSPGGREGPPRLVPVLVASADPSPFIMVQVGMAERDDLFLCTTMPTVTCSNLTQSPAITEVWPVLDTTVQRVAYYSVGDASTELYVLALPNGMALPLTVHAGMSGLHTDFEITPTLAPSFAPDGSWVAFPAQAVKGNAVELFVAQDDGQQVLRVTDLGYRVRDYIWLDDKKLVIAVQWPDDTMRYWIAQLESGEVQLDPLP